MPSKPRTVGAYSDCLAILEKVLTHKGGQLRFAERGTAINFQQRCYRIRKILQDHSTTKPTELPHSPYDAIVIKLEPKEGNREDPATLHFVFRDVTDFAEFIPAEPADDLDDLMTEALAFKKELKLE